MTPSDLETQILTLLDGELPTGEAAELEALLLQDEEARETYRTLVHLHNALESRFAAEPIVRKMAILPMDRLIAAQQRQLAHRALLAAAAILVISVVTLWLILAPKQAVTLGAIRTTPDSLLALSYEGEGEAPEGNHLVEGARLRLTKGTMEGTFESGVRLVAEAPCELIVMGEDEVRLESGKAWFQVPPAAIGFAVNTRDLKVIDLGTEFGVLSSLAGPDAVHVLKGKVEVTSLHGSGGKQTLSAGSARQVGAGGELDKIEPDASLFETKLLTPREIAIANHSFEDDVLPRDGNHSTKETGEDDYDKDQIPSGWLGFDDGDGETESTRGILSTAPDSYFNTSLAVTPDSDANDQVFYSAAPDIYQVLAEPLQPNSTYAIRVNIGDRDTSGAEGEPGNPGIRLGFGNQPGKGIMEPLTTHAPKPPDGGWVTWTATYKTGPEPAGLGEPLRIELTSGSQVGWFDCVRLSVSSQE